MICGRCGGLVVNQWGDLRCLICGARPLNVPLTNGKGITKKLLAKIEARRVYDREYRKKNAKRVRERERVSRRRQRNRGSFRTQAHVGQADAIFE
ncbi:MAG: hypothetical protein ACREI9_08450 [Nitrospiraceae bacterium]